MVRGSLWECLGVIWLCLGVIVGKNRRENRRPQSGKNKEILPSNASVFHGQTPLRDPAINPTIIDIVIDLNFFRRVLKILDKKIKPQTDPNVKKNITFNKYILSESLIKSKLNENISVKVKYSAFTESTIIKV